MYPQRVLERVFAPSGFSQQIADEFASILPGLLATPGIVGAGIGMKQKGNELLAEFEPCIVVFVEKKRPEKSLKSSAFIPRHINGFPTDIVELKPRNQAGPTLGPGRRIAVDGIGQGSAGVVARDSSARNVLITAGHCLYGKKSFRKGIGVRLPDGGAGAPIVGTTHDIHFGLDCGLVLLNGGEFTNDTVCSDVQLGAPIAPVVGTTLEKCGAVSGRTQAVVSTISRVGQLFPAITLTPPLDDIDPNPLSEEGDSGSIWYDPTTNAVVGLHVQGSRKTKKRGEYGVATVMTDILRAFDLDWT